MIRDGILGFNENVTTKPLNLDGIVSNGVIFNRLYSASVICSPIRASLITGRNPLRMGIKYANVGHMKEEEITDQKYLRRRDMLLGISENDIWVPC